jgi:hypothetical protein
MNEEKSNNTEFSHYISAFKYIDWNEVGWGLSEFSFGFCNQGLNTLTGAYSALKDLSDLTREDIVNTNYVEFGKYMYKSFAVGLGNTIYNAIHGDPESTGRAAFDIIMIVDGGGKIISNVARPLGTKITKIVLPKEVTSVSSSNRYFWSGGSIPKKVAKKIAKENGGNTLEMTREGRITELLTTDVFTGKIPNRYYGNWNQLSLSFAEGTTGEARAILNAKGINKNSTYLLYEKPILQKSNIKLVEYVTDGNITKRISLNEKIKINNPAAQNISNPTTPNIYSPIITSIYLGGKISKISDIEGGHKLDPKVRTVILLDSIIKIGFYKQIDKLGVTYISLNSIDLYRVNAGFIAKIISGNTNAGNFEDKDIKLKTRNEVVPNKKREQRGL